MDFNQAWWKDESWAEEIVIQTIQLDTSVSTKEFYEVLAPNKEVFPAKGLRLKNYTAN